VTAQIDIETAFVRKDQAMRALVVEDNLVDATKCVSLLKKLGATDIDAVGMALET
jgi:hypothetical protein